MAKDKNRGKNINDNKGLVSEWDKLISGWEEKLSIAKVNKNTQEIESSKRMIEYYKKKRSE